MAHPLAEAICELAAPPHQPCYIRLQAVNRSYDPAQCLVLHVRPRPHAAGLEVAAYPGWLLSSDGEDGFDLIGLRRRGARYALPASSGGLAEFAADLLAAGPCDASGDGYPLPDFVLSQRVTPYTPWALVRCGLYDPADVQPAAVPPGDPLGYTSALKFPSDYAPGADAPLALASATVGNAADDYVSTQDARKSNKRKRESAVDGAAGEAAAAPAALPEPDSPAEYERKYRQLRDEAMAELTAALVTLLRHAARYRGTVEFEPPLPPAPAAAGGEQAGEQAAA